MRSEEIVLCQNLKDQKQITFCVAKKDQDEYLISCYFVFNHNYNKIVKSDWLSTALISALIGQFNRAVRVMPK